MRKPKFNELATLMFAFYVWFTLTIDPNLFADTIAQNPDSMYQSYIDMVGSQANLAYLSLAVSVIVFISFFIRNYNVRIIMHVVNILYFTFIAASYIFNYPNLALGLLIIVACWQLYEANLLIDESEKVKSQKCIIDNYEGGKRDE